MPSASPQSSSQSFKSQDANLSKQAPLSEQESLNLIEGLFFGYRDFTIEADSLFSRRGFGRAHHRVLHFTAKQDRLSLQELLEILKVSKQALHRVLQDLTVANFITLTPDPYDQRRRILSLTPEGRTEIARIQTAQIASMQKRCESFSESERATIHRFLAALRQTA